MITIFPSVLCFLYLGLKEGGFGCNWIVHRFSILYCWESFNKVSILFSTHIQDQLNSRVLNHMLTSKRIPKCNLMAYEFVTVYFVLYVCVSFVNSCEQYCRDLSFICYFVSMIQDWVTIMFRNTENKSKFMVAMVVVVLKDNFYHIYPYVYISMRGNSTQKLLS